MKLHLLCYICFVDLGVWCLTTLSTICQLYYGGQFLLLEDILCALHGFHQNAPILAMVSVLILWDILL